MQPQVITDGVDYIFLTIPPLVVLGVWLAAMYHANAHPEVRHVGGRPGQAISGPAGPEAPLAAGGASEHRVTIPGQRIAAGDQATAGTEPGQQSRLTPPGTVPPMS
ncbi:MAG TPA: hypothetical protein VHU92_11475 [Streptosporangiaceae bacterium]|jgi:hypothetical protein|nr:hypothetical protein [Streptosporangiaceae bacterium]